MSLHKKFNFEAPKSDDYVDPRFKGIDSKSMWRVHMQGGSSMADKSIVIDYESLKRIVKARDLARLDTFSEDQTTGEFHPSTIIFKDPWTHCEEINK